MNEPTIEPTEQPSIPAIPPPTLDHEDSAQSGKILAGKYKLLNVIGEGGMGAVWMAEQRSPVKRLVALKLIKAGMDSKMVLRDIKPSNVMVSLYDDRPVPKVIDFGVAKATGQALTEQTLNTGFSVVGTPQYMSPEQATFNQIDIDTRSDIYSLGVLLYELLAGSPPFQKKELEKAGYLSGEAVHAQTNLSILRCVSSA